MPLRSGAFRTGLSPFGSGILPPYQGATGVITPPGSVPPRGSPPSSGKTPPHRGPVIPKVKHVPVRNIPKPTSRPIVKKKPKKKPTGIEAVGTVKQGAHAAGNVKPKPKPIPTPGGGGIHYKT